MIKGVNKRIIEINNPDSIYFEKAIFYLKPSVRELPTSITEREIERFTAQLGLEYYKPHKSGRNAKIAFLIISLLSFGGILFSFLH